MRKVSGVNIQWPWSELIISGQKKIETRSYPLPKKFENIELAVIQTPGPKGRARGILKASIVGTVVFSSSKEFKSRADWIKDQAKHLVSLSDPQFAYDPQKPKWGWLISKVVRFDVPQPVPKKRGIIFAKDCKIP